jgi:hypothetical protein
MEHREREASNITSSVESLTSLEVLFAGEKGRGRQFAVPKKDGQTEKWRKTRIAKAQF